MSLSSEQIKLIKDLKDKSAKVREEAALQLIYFSTSEALPSLILLLKDPVDAVKVAALQALEELKSPESIEAIMGCLQDDNLRVQKTAKRALMQMGEAVYPHIKEKFQQVSPTEKVTFLDILTRLDTPADQKQELALLSLSHDNSGVRRAALKVLKKLGDAKSQAGILKALVDSDETVRQEAIRACQRYAHPEVIQTLLERVLHEEQQELWLDIGRVLLGFEHRAVSPMIHTLLFNQNPEVQEFTALILGDIQHPQAIPHLKQLLEDTEYISVKRAVLVALQSLENNPLWRVLATLFGEPSIAQIEALEELSTYPVSEKLWWALLTSVPAHLKAPLILHMANDFQHVAHLLYPLLQDPSPDVRNSVISVLSQEEGSQHLLEPLVADSNPQVRLSALKGLQGLEPESDFWQSMEQFFHAPHARVLHKLVIQDIQRHAPLLLALFDQDLSSHQYMALVDALQRDPHPGLATQFLEKLNITEDPELSVVLIVALQRLGYKDAKVVLYRHLYSPHESLRQVASKAIQELQVVDLIELQEMFKSELWFVREQVFVLLPQLSASPARLELLKKGAKDKDRDVRKAAIRAMGQLKSPQFLNPLVDALELGFRDVREEAARALSQFEDAREDLYEAFEEDDEDAVRLTIALAMADWKDPEALAYLEEGLLQDESHKVRQACAHSLGRLRQGEIALAQALQDPVPAVVQSALSSLSQCATQSSLRHLKEHLFHGQSDLRATAARCLEGTMDPEIQQALLNLVDEDEYLKVRKAALNSLVVTPLDTEMQAAIDLKLATWPPELQVKALKAFLNCPQKLRKDLKDQSLAPLVLEAIQGQNLPELSAEIHAQFAKLEDPENQKKAIYFWAQFDDETHLIYLFQAVITAQEPQVKECAVHALMSKGEQAHPFLKELFNIWDTNLHGFLAQSAITLGDSIVPLLLELLQELPAEQTRWIVYALGELQAESALPAMHELAPKVPDLYPDIIKAMTRIGPAAEPWLQPIMESENRTLRALAAQALDHIFPNNPLWRLHMQLNNPLSFERLKALKRQLTVTHLPQLHGLTYLLEDADLNVRKYFYQMLSMAPVPELKGALEAQLITASQALMPDLILALAPVSDNADVFEPFLSSLNPDIRHSAVLAVGKHQKWEWLKPLLQDPNIKVQMAVFKVFGSSKKPELAQELLVFFEKPMTESAQRALISALGELAAPEALQALQAKLTHDISYDLQRSLLEALRHYPPEDIQDALLAFLNSPESVWMDVQVQIQVIRMLGQSQNLTPWDTLVKLFHEPTWKDTQIKLAALEALLQIDNEKARGFLYQAKEDEDERVVRFAEQKLAEIYST